MSSITAIEETFAGLPRVLPGDAAAHLVRADGSVVARTRDDGTAFAAGDDGPGVRAAEGREDYAVPLSQGEDGALWAVLTFPGGTGPEMAAVLRALLDAAACRLRLEQDLEAMDAGSLPLLEEVSMIGDTLPRLATLTSDRQVAADALRALVVAASVERALYVSYHPETGICEVVVHAVLDDETFHAREAEFDGDPVFLAEDGVVGRALGDTTDAILEAVPETGGLGLDGSPEQLAQRQLIAVPVTCGDSDDRVVLGALLVMDKRSNAFSSNVKLGSQETKLTQAVAAIMGSVLGARRVAAMGKELSLAQQIQGQILPQEAARVDGFDLAADYRTSGDVGGDYFDYLPMADGRTLAVVADVSGHNLASGMVMVSARAALRVLAADHDDPSAVFDLLSRALFGDLMRTERFVTAAGLAIGPGSREVELVSAGHNDVLWYRAASGEVERLPSESTIFGFIAEASYPARRLEVAEGDVLLLYTDGITEATDDGDEMFGEERLCEVLGRAAGGSAREIVDTVFGAVNSFADRSMRGDDVTALAIKVGPEQGADR